MFVRNLNLFILPIIFTFISSQTETQLPSDTTSQETQKPSMTPEQIAEMCQKTCMPIPQCIDMYLFDNIDGYNCSSLLAYPNSENMTFRCCELEFQEKDNSSAPRRHGCIGILPSYVDNDRYEDIIDWIERGKADTFEQYSIYLGKAVHDAYLNFIKNETDYEVYKFDCSTKYINSKYFIFYILIVLLL